MPKAKSKTKTPGKHKGAGSATFKRARVRFPNIPPIHAGREVIFQGTMSKLGRTGHRACDDIREALTIWGGKVGTFAPDKIPGNGEWSDRQEEVWRRFRLWHSPTRRANRKERMAVIMFICGYRPTAIERELHVWQGVGKARRMILAGIEDYCVMAGWVKNNS